MNKRLFVAGLPFSINDEELRNLFIDIGNVVSAKVIIDSESGRSKGFGFVEMEKSEDVQNAITKLNNTDFGGRMLVVNEARPQEEKSSMHSGYKRDFGNKYKFQKRSFGKRREEGRGSFGRSRYNR